MANPRRLDGARPTLGEPAQRRAPAHRGRRRAAGVIALAAASAAPPAGAGTLAGPTGWKVLSATDAFAWGWSASVLPPHAD